jgi:hypothetical protein
VFLQSFQYHAGYPPVFLNGFGKDEDVVQINADYSFQNEILKDVVHHCLEGSWAIG